MRAMKKLFVFLIICIFLYLSIFQPTISKYCFQEFQIDQQQLEHTNHGWLSGYFFIGQSFKPTLNMLSRIEFLFSKRGNLTGNIQVTIRDDLNGTDLISSSLNPDILQYYPDFNWLAFDFVDFQVIPEKTYYILLRGDSTWDRDNCLLYLESNENPYYRGKSLYSLDYVSWFEEEVFDLCFKTYGYNDIIKSCIEIEDIEGGFGLKATINNNGTNTAENINWSIDIDLGFGNLLSGDCTDGIIEELPAVESTIIHTSDLKGIGPITITIKADDATKQATGFLLGPLVLRVEEV